VGKPAWGKEGGQERRRGAAGQRRGAEDPKKQVTNLPRFLDGRDHEHGRVDRLEHLQLARCGVDVSAGVRAARVVALSIKEGWCDRLSTRTHARTCTHASTHARTHTHTNTHADEHTHTYTCIPAGPCDQGAERRGSGPPPPSQTPPSTRA